MFSLPPVFRIRCLSREVVTEKGKLLPSREKFFAIVNNIVFH